jgi:hypothetical protein
MFGIHKIRRSVAALAASLCTAGAASAAIVVDDNVSWLSDGTSNVGYTIDRISFSVGSTSQVTVDLLSAGILVPSLDTSIYLAADDGDIQLVDFLYSNDDGALGSDGSVFELDSFLDVELAAGNYMLYVSGCCYSSGEALAGYRLVAGSEPFQNLVDNGVFGNYRATISGDVTLIGVAEGPPIPVPAAGWLFLSAIVLLLRNVQRKI